MGQTPCCPLQELAERQKNAINPTNGIYGVTTCVIQKNAPSQAVASACGLSFLARREILREAFFL